MQDNDKYKISKKLKIIYGVFLVIILMINICLTFQSQNGTVKLSEGVRLWLEHFGIYTDFHSFRSNAHLVMFFFIGIALTLFGKTCNWKWWVILLIGCLIGLIDESIKIYLPTREFDVIDLMKDCIGIILGMIAVLIVKLLKYLFQIRG